MSMNFSEFKHQLGAEPGSQDPEFLRARNSSPEFAKEAEAADQFEQKLLRATQLPVPANWVEELKPITQGDPSGTQTWRRYALAASLVIAVAAAALVWRMDESRDVSLESDLAFHYQADGNTLLLLANGQPASNVEDVLAHFQVQMTPELSHMVGYIKICVTPDGESAHMVLQTQQGLVTLIFMPDRAVIDGDWVVFDGMKAQLVSVANGSAAIIGTSDQDISGIYALVVNSITPRDTSA